MTSFFHFLGRHAAMLRWLWAGVIFLLCSMPGEYIPSNNWLELLSVDKLVHAGIFFTLAALFMLRHFQLGQVKSRLYLIVLLCILYSMSLEWMQATLFRNRSADWKDIIANSFGCLLALLATRQLKKIAAF